MKKEDLENFKGKLIWILKKEDTQTVSLTGWLKAVSDDAITIQTEQSIRLISLGQIIEVKIRNGEDRNGRNKNY